MGSTGSQIEKALLTVRSIDGEYNVLQTDSVGSQVGDGLKGAGFKA